MAQTCVFCDRTTSNKLQLKPGTGFEIVADCLAQAVRKESEEQRDKRSHIDAAEIPQAKRARLD